MSEPQQDRKRRCFRLVDLTNGLKIRGAERCPNEAVPTSDLCVPHLAEAMDDCRRLLGRVGLWGDEQARDDRWTA